MRVLSFRRPTFRRCLASLGAGLVLVLGGGCVSWEPLFRVAAWLRSAWPFG
ncbi:MAG: hypothetical protein AAF800_04860 [Planctomycetota bacterium]